MKNGMITIEVLISLLILFLTVATSSIAIKHLIFIEEQQKSYEKLYGTLQSIKDLIDLDICTHKNFISGEFNGYRYEANCRLLAKTREYRKSMEEDEPEGNLGVRKIYLYRVDLNISSDNQSHSYHYNKFGYRVGF